MERAEAEKLFRGEDGLEDMQFQAGKVEKKLKQLKPSAAPGPDKVWIRAYTVKTTKISHFNTTHGEHRE